MNSSTDELSEQQLLNSCEADYMDSHQLAFFRTRLIELHDSTCARIQEAKEQMVNPMLFSDPCDRASCEEQSGIALRIIDREQKLLPKIKQALGRIRAGTYGYCLESGEEIGIPRLLARPTAEYCAEIKARKEIKKSYIKVNK